MRKSFLCPIWFTRGGFLWLLGGHALIFSETFQPKGMSFAQGASMHAYFQQSLGNQEILVPLLLACLAGLFSALSPCVYPLIPITLSIMGARQYESHIQGFLVSLSYVLGMSLVFTVLGVAFASLGKMFGAVFQHPYVLLAITCLFIALALSMLGAFDLALPEPLARRLTHFGGQGKKGAFLMGLVAGFIAAPCTGPVLGFILTLIANSENLVFGFFLMLLFSLGMGAPFLLLGTFSSMIARMPKSGLWLLSIKRVFGACMLGAAFYYSGLLAPRFNGFLVSLSSVGLVPIILLFVLGISLLTLPAMGKFIGAKPLQIGLGASMVACTIAAIIVAQWNTTDVHEEIDGLTWHVIDADSHDTARLDNLLFQGKMENKPVLIDFYADWCVACTKLEQTTFRAKNVSSRLAEFLLLRVDATRASEYITELQTRFNVLGLPTIVFFDKHGHVIESARVVGFLEPDQFLEIINKIP